MKSAGAYKKESKILIQAYSETIDGIDELNGPIFVCNENDLPSKIGQNILDALNESRKGVPNPDPSLWKEEEKNDPILKAAGVKTWNAMMKSSKKTTVILDRGQINLIPKKFSGTKGDGKGYHSLKDKAITSDLDPENLGRALLEAFEKCE